MYVCLCNRLTDSQVCSAVLSGRATRAGQVHRACGCSVKCGSCLANMLKIIEGLRQVHTTPLRPGEPRKKAHQDAAIKEEAA